MHEGVAGEYERGQRVHRYVTGQSRCSPGSARVPLQLGLSTVTVITITAP